MRWAKWKCFKEYGRKSDNSTATCKPPDWTGYFKLSVRYGDYALDCIQVDIIKAAVCQLEALWRLTFPVSVQERTPLPNSIPSHLSKASSVCRRSSRFFSKWLLLQQTVSLEPSPECKGQRSALELTATESLESRAPSDTINHHSEDTLGTPRCSWTGPFCHTASKGHSAKTLFVPHCFSHGFV